jgi:hypothetical protein
MWEFEHRAATALLREEMPVCRGVRSFRDFNTHMMAMLAHFAMKATHFLLFTYPHTIS